MTFNPYGWHGWRSLLVAALLALGSAIAQAQTHEVAIATELRATPALNAQVLKHMKAGEQLDVLQTQGGWAKVKIGNAEGWVRLSHLKALQPASGSQASGGGGGLVSLFTAASTKPTATTGTRGLTQEQLANAQPAPQEVRQLENYAVTAAQARQFAHGGKLQARHISDYTGAEQ